MDRSFSVWLATVVLAAVVMVAVVPVGGCDSSAPAKSHDHAAMMMAEEPDGALTPTDVMEQLVQQASDQSADLTEQTAQVVLAGRIHAGDIDPFQEGQATFMLTQLPDEGHGADDPDHADNCPFCKKRLERAPKVIVQFKDAQGKVIATDAKELFGVAKGDAVVVRGTAHYQEAINTLDLDATAIFKR